MPSSLTTLLPPALGFSPHPPVSVYGTGTYGAIAAFLDSMYPDFATIISLPVTPLAYCADLPAQRLLCLDRSFLSRLPLTPRVPTVLTICSTGISTCCPSATSSDLALGPDLPRQISFTLESLDIRPIGFSPISRYSFRHSLFNAVHCSLRYSFFPHSMLLYQPCGSAASAACFSPGHFRRRTSRLVSYYALFE